MNNVFTISGRPDPKFLVLLPDNICYKSNAIFLKDYLVGLTPYELKHFAFLPIPVPRTGKIKKDVVADILKEAKVYAETLGIDIIMIGHADTWQMVTNKARFTENFGRAKTDGKFSYGSGKNKIEIDFKGIYLVPFLNPIIIKKYPYKRKELELSLKVLDIIDKGEYKDGFNVDFTLDYSSDLDIITSKLSSFLNEERLYVDIETTGLKWYKDRLLTISFATDNKEAFCIPIHPQYHDVLTYIEIKTKLKEFFLNYKGSLIGHNWIGFDQAFIIHEIMRDNDFNLPHEPLIDKFKLEDTLLMAYLLKNSTEREKIGLKELGFKYLGDWDKEIDQDNLIKTSLEEVATYNNLDVVATKKIYADLWEELKKERMLATYNNLKQIGYVLLKMKMNGLRIDLDKTEQVFEDFQFFIKEARDKMLENKYVQQAMKYYAYEKKSKDKRVNKKNLEDYIEPFNPNSNPQKQILFFSIMDLPVIKMTKAKNPSSDKETVAEWLSNPDIPDDKKEVLNLIEEFIATEKIRNTYLKNMLEDCVEVKKGDYRIYANFNQTGTISGRLSSSGVINFQTIPSGSKYGKLVKSLFIAPDGFLLGASDYSALEDRLMANASQDKNKIAPFVAGIDG